MFTDSQLLEKVNIYLSHLIYGKQPEGLYNPIKYAMSLGGKRIRPVLMLMAYNLYRDDVDCILSQAAGVETYHNFTLLHDDLMDNADLRRGKPTVHAKWSKNAAILSGDAMMLIAYRLMTDEGSKYVPSVMRVFSQAALEVCEGQQYDMDFETRMDVSEDEFRRRIRIVNNIVKNSSNEIRSDNMNVLLQHVNYLLIQALHRSDPRQLKELMSWLHAKDYNPQEKIKAVTSLYDALNIRSLCEERISYYTQLAEISLDKVKVAKDKKQPLLREMNKLMFREA